MRNVPSRSVLWVALGAVILCMPFLGTLPLADPDEGFYPAAAAESLEHGHPLDLTLNGEPRWNKPPLAYAFMQASFLVFGRNEFAARLPSVLEGAALAALLGFAVTAAAGARAGLLSAVVLATSLGHQVMSRAAHPEMALVLGTATAQLLLALWFVSFNDTKVRWMPWAAGLAMGFGFLAKGPVALLLPALMVVAGMLVLPRDSRPPWGVLAKAFGPAALLATALAAPWYLWMGARHGDPFWDTTFGQLSHYTSEEHEHFGNHLLYFVPVLIAGFLPWIWFLPPALKGLRRTGTDAAGRFSLLMALAAGTSFLFWSLSTSKLPNYGLVFLPPLAAVVGIRMVGASTRAVIVPALVSVALLQVGLFSAGGIPELQPAMRDFASVLGSPGPAARAPVAVYRKRAPSLTFYTGQEVPWPHTPGDLAAFLEGPGPRWLVIRERHLSVVPPGTMTETARSGEWVLIRRER